jgi:hypothetical protein
MDNRSLGVQADIREERSGGTGSNLGVPACLDAPGRLTLTTAVPVPVADVTGAGTLYYTPYGLDKIGVLVGHRWEAWPLAELSVSLAGVAGAGSIYDAFVGVSGASLALTLGTVWSTATARAVALARVNGVWVSSADTRLRYVGSVYGSGAGTVDDSIGLRGVFNADNRVLRSVRSTDNSTRTRKNTQYAQVGSVQVAWLDGLGEVDLDLRGRAQMKIDSSSYVARLAIGVDATNARDSLCSAGATAVTAEQTLVTFLTGYPRIGYHYAALLMSSSNNLGTATATGNLSDGPNTILCGQVLV